MGLYYSNAFARDIALRWLQVARVAHKCGIRIDAQPDALTAFGGDAMLRHLLVEGGRPKSGPAVS